MRHANLKSLVKRLVIVGQAPGPNSGRRPFDGLSGDRLARYMGLEDRRELRERVDLRNVLKTYPGPAGDKGDAFPARVAEEAARRLSARLRGRSVLLAGRNVARAFGVRSEYLAWATHERGFDVVVIPHPSGVNKWWNDSRNRARFLRFSRRTLAQR